MKKEDKELLLKDICSRLPYNIKCYYKRNGTEGSYHKIIGILDDAILANGYQLILGIDVVKLYLRSMSSMTEDEEKEYINIDNRSYSCPKDYAHIPASDRIDWLNSHYFDYRGLIKRDLAIEVDKNFYK